MECSALRWKDEKSENKPVDLSSCNYHAMVQRMNDKSNYVDSTGYVQLCNSFDE